MTRPTFMKRRRLMVIGVLLIVVVLVLASLPPLRWRVELVALHLAGKIPDIELGEMVRFMMPGSEQTMTRLVETRNPHAVIRNFHVSASDVAAGAATYRAQCANCHAPDGTGGPVAPALVGRAFKNGAGDWAIYRTIRLGVPNTPMAPHPLPPEQLWQLVAFLRSIATRAQHGEAASDSKTEIFVASEEIEAPAPREDWLTYSGSLRSTRHSGLTQITRNNARELGLRWLYPYPGEPGKVETSPIVRKGVMFVTVPPGRVMALDALTGKLLWQQQSLLSPEAAGGEFGQPSNRGVAVLGDKIFIGTGDAHLIARSAATGQEIWNVDTAHEPSKYYISSAPLALKDMVVTGVGNKGGGIGFIAAYDAATGEERWRFRTIPGPNEEGHDTWGGESWKEGGAPTWLTGSYDAEQNLLLWGVGNPKPDYDAAARAGDNLYSNCVLALDATTGKLKWFFQFTPADDRDWDSNQIPVLADWTNGGVTEKRLLWANRNGFYYVIDRVSGKFMGATPFVRQNWTDGLDGNGRPLPRKDLTRNPQGFMIYPGNIGGTNWWSPSYDASLGLIFVPVLEQGMVFFPSANSWPTGSNLSFYTAVRALDARTGKLVWEHKRKPRTRHAEMGSVLSTDSGVLFSADESKFFALDSRTGEELWAVETGGAISSPPVTYQVNGQQFVVVSSGRNLMSFALPRTAAALTANQN
jgi:alcohol dehydrogenase (cytochrome c)